MQKIKNPRRSPSSLTSLLCFRFLSAPVPVTLSNFEHPSSGLQNGPFTLSLYIRVHLRQFTRLSLQNSIVSPDFRLSRLLQTSPPPFVAHAHGLLVVPGLFVLCMAPRFYSPTPSAVHYWTWCSNTGARLPFHSSVRPRDQALDFLLFLYSISISRPSV